MNEWLDDLADLTASRAPAVVVMVARVRGSAPREPGSRMIVTTDETIGTIGGGQLEYQCARIAVSMLGSNEIPSLRSFPLGSAMGQCCGGVVDVVFEPLDDGLPFWLADLRALHGQHEPAVLVTGVGAAGGKFVITANDIFGPGIESLPGDITDRARVLLTEKKPAEFTRSYLLEPVAGSDFNIALFGAGHVGTALCHVLAKLECNIRWIDGRRGMFGRLPANVRAIDGPEPALEVAAMPSGSYYLVMTHSHALDFAICDRILRRDDVAYCGLIGSLSKRRRFEKRFRAQGMPESAIEALVCPIGVDGISGKKPAEIAVATAAELLQARERVAGAASGLPDNVRFIKRRNRTVQ